MADSPHVYEVKLTDGRAYRVETGVHHETVHEKHFMDHLVDVLKGAAGGAAAHRAYTRDL